MNDVEASHMRERLVQFDKLHQRAAAIEEAIAMLRAEDPEAPCKSDPFTGNWRESRQILSMKIEFSPTRGGAKATSRIIVGGEIEAHEIGSRLAEAMRANLNKIMQEIERL